MNPSVDVDTDPLIGLVSGGHFAVRYNNDFKNTSLMQTLFKVVYLLYPSDTPCTNLRLCESVRSRRRSRVE